MSITETITTASAVIGAVATAVVGPVVRVYKRMDARITALEQSAGDTKTTLEVIKTDQKWIVQSQSRAEVKQDEVGKKIDGLVQILLEKER